MDKNYNPFNNNENNDTKSDETLNGLLDAMPTEENTKKPRKKLWLFITLPLILVIIIIIVLIIAFGGNDKNDNNEVSNENSMSQAENPKEEIKKEIKKHGIDFDVVYEYDDNLEERTSVVKEEGTFGYELYEREVTYINGEIAKTSEWILTDTVEPINKVIVVGTRKIRTDGTNWDLSELTYTEKLTSEQEEKVRTAWSSSNSIVDILAKEKSNSLSFEKDGLMAIISEPLFMYELIVFFDLPIVLESNTYTFFDNLDDDLKLLTLNNAEKLEIELKRVYQGTDLEFYTELTEYMNELSNTQISSFYTFIDQTEEFAKEHGLEIPKIENTN